MDKLDIAFAGVRGQRRLLRAGVISSRELVELLLTRISALDWQLGAFRVVLAEQALAAADEADRLRKGGEDLPLLGVPIAVKDEMDVAGVVTSHGSRGYTRVARQDSEIVRRLRDAGAIIIGKTNMPEFGAWPFTESELHGKTCNPWDLSRTPGGSSGGSAAAVAAGLVPAATAGDGGGSIRIPAACCGLFGLKPQRGRISTMPKAEAWAGLVSIGFVTRSVEDSALLTEVVWGAAPGDRWSAGAPRQHFDEAARTDPQRLRIVVSERSPVLGVTPAEPIREALRTTAQALRDLGHDVEERPVRLPDPTLGFLARDVTGIREAIRDADDPSLVEERNRHYAAALRPVAASLPVAQAASRRANRRLAKLFHEYDLLVVPTIPDLPAPLGRLDDAGFIRAPLRSVRPISYTSLFNVTGNPAAAVPAGFSNGLPLSVQFVARTDDEATIFQVAGQLERARPWTKPRPSVAT